MYILCCVFLYLSVPLHINLILTIILILLTSISKLENDASKLLILYWFEYGCVVAIWVDVVGEILGFENGLTVDIMGEVDNWILREVYNGMTIHMNLKGIKDPVWSKNLLNSCFESNSINN